ncbi:adenylate/guanylate cyclase domain-containing protein [Anaeromyxobacter sp. PSR-1]|uniref:adenylate/guanylate cyclase domain-containing protein n=1 Tax=Anaeromyxobacter sp. PSR-1 TaxID=1300915 RepID=UPI000750D9C5|nr:adenylate/guanylate cyclase domain-containing protein [Anaeromyxobacter sp. PSR-1]
MKDAFDGMKDVDLKPLTREMDLENLALKEARIVTAAHVYLDVTNFQKLLEDRRENTSELKKLLRHLAVFQRQAERVLRTHAGAVRIHFQGARLHFIVHKPYDTEEGAELARLVAAVTIVEQLRQLGALVRLQTDIRFEFEAGIASGDAIATMNSGRNNRQLLFVGPPANDAAKVLTGSPGERLAASAEGYRDDLPAAADRDPLPESFESAVKEDVDAHPIESFEIVDVREAIDYERLGKRVARLSSAATLYGDVSGFTAYVAGLTDDATKKIALQHLHALRTEMQAIVEVDYGGDFVQFQGDRVQGLFYELRSTGRFTSKTVEAAAALCSAIDVAKDLFPELKTLDMANGADLGKVLVGRVGLKGDKEVIVVGRSVARADELQRGCKDGFTAITVGLWEAIEPALQKHFTLEAGRRVSDIDIDRLEAKKTVDSFPARIKVGGSLSAGATFTPVTEGGSKPARSYGE